MSEAIAAYRRVSVSDKFIQLEKAMSKARHDEAQALFNAKRLGAEERDAHWQGIVAGKDAALADRDARIADLEAMLRSQK